MDLDIGQFILEIESRPAIWNTKCEAYSDRVEKVKQWEEVVNIFTDPGLSNDKKRKQGRILQKKWRNLRDAFVKERRQLATAKSGSATITKKQYKYFDHLLFLLPVTSTNTTDNSLESEENSHGFAYYDTESLSSGRPYEENNVSVDRPSEENLESARKRKRSTPTEEIGSELINVLKSTLQQKTEEEDPDRQFFLSLVNDFKSVPMKLKPVVKMNILKCIVEAQDDMYECQETHNVNHRIKTPIKEEL